MPVLTRNSQSENNWNCHIKQYPCIGGTGGGGIAETKTSITCNRLAIVLLCELH